MLGLPGADLQAYLAVAAVVLTFIIIFDYTGYQKALRRLHTILSIRERCDEIYEQERCAEPARPKPLAALAEAVSSAVKPEPAEPEAVSAPSEAKPVELEPEAQKQEEPAPEKKKRFGRKNKKQEAPAPVILPEEVPAEAVAESSSVLAETEPAPAPEAEMADAREEQKESPFESLTPEKDAAND